MNTTARFDLYAHIHKALRLFMTDTLQQLGRVDVEDPHDLGATLAQLDALLDAARHHVDKENRFVHPAIEARRSGTSATIAGEHVEHLETIAALQAAGAALRALPSSAAAHGLYRQLAAFVADNFEHMAVEESVHNEALWATYTDEELLALHHSILSSIPPQEMSQTLRWMIPALTPAERAVVLGGLPEPVQQPVLDSARALLDDVAWRKLNGALGRPSVPGLVAA
ncbi:hemerythrin domain-containing protein [Roseateles cellulosilyticus]|uniref:Hemerythrin domain-containing protein n=1 Tax=Pelomonas cellulosilytica TaxID=2906762 RepID=A0ABS8Y4B9_9BURK|nr:hemerythrin domain-containing protein [Pelomonas sp. P8]MCE4558162.1 hemerythrin domain-containing protein [Pelomonas sp. P8]